MKRVITSAVMSEKKTNNINHVIASKFTQLADIYLSKGDNQLKFKANALKAAAKKVKDCPELITTPSIAMQKAGISERMAIKIKEILETGNLAELEEQTPPPTNEVAIEELCQITGIGPKKAQSLIDEGYTSIAKLRQGVADKKVAVTHHISVGLKWANDLNERMPREEVAQMETIIKQAAAKVNPDLMVVIAGSYRRQKNSCGDVDCLISSKAHQGEEIADYGYLNKIVKELTSSGFIKDSLTNEGEKKYMGVCQLASSNSKGRRIDIRMVNYDNFYAALLYFTGSANFNIKLRKTAMELGLKLNEYSFESNKTGKKILVHSEKEIFDILGMEYVLPTDRNI